jgi:hypothetical protein
MPIQFRGITYTEHIPGSPQEVLENDRAQVTRVYDCAWADRQTFADKLLGYPSVKTATDNTTKYISRVIPDAHPDFLNASGQPWLFATRVTRIEGIGFRGKNANVVPVYDTARLTVLYESLTYEVLSDQDLQSQGNTNFPDEATLRRYVTKYPKAYTEFVTLRPGTLQWVDTTPAPMNVGFPFIVGAMMIDYVWHLVPKQNAPIAAIKAALGTVNKTTFDLDYNFKPETLLLMSHELKPVRSALGDRLYDIVYHCKYFEPPQSGFNTGHNFGLRRVGNTEVRWNRASFDGTSDEETIFGRPNKPYQLTDFSLLFRPM